MDTAVKMKSMQVSFLKKFSNPLLDKTIFYPIRKKLGGNLRIMITGSAPIDPEVHHYLKLVFGCPILEGYGQTETTGYATMTWESDLECGHLGGINKYDEFKLVDVKDLNYKSTDKDENGNKMPQGELWLRGHGIINEYYCLEEQTKSTFTEDGWIKTGDIF